MAKTSVTQIITIPVAAVTEFITSGNPTAMIINSAAPGSQPNPVIVANTTYNLTTNESNKKITGVLDKAMPGNTYLKVCLAAPPGAVSLGDVSLSIVPADLVTGISKVATSGKTITYKFSCAVAAGVIASSTRVVTFTVTN
ncbi:MAG: hypothetical protein ACM3X9_01570 [Bacillota bacterium]